MNNIADEKIAQVIGKMLRETIEGTIKWDILDNTSNICSTIDGYDTLVGNVYHTIIDDKNIRLYKYKTRYFVDMDEWYITMAYQLEFFNIITYNTLWVFPSSNSTVDLYNEVSYKTSGADDFIKKYLK